MNGSPHLVGLELVTRAQDLSTLGTEENPCWSGLNISRGNNSRSTALGCASAAPPRHVCVCLLVGEQKTAPPFRQKLRANSGPMEFAARTVILQPDYDDDGFLKGSYPCSHSFVPFLIFGVAK